MVYHFVLFFISFPFPDPNITHLICNYIQLKPNSENNNYKYETRMYLWKCAREQNVWALRLSEIYRSLYKAKCQTSILLFVWLPTHYFFSLWMASWNGTLGNIEKGLKKRNEWPAMIKLVPKESNHSTIFPSLTYLISPCTG